jgi:sugar/nucleoside kinase (ribokinase family)
MSLPVPLAPVDYLVIGHVAHDITPEGYRLGGTAAYSALTARALGLRVGVVTVCGPETSLDALAGIPLVNQENGRSTTFENIYTPEGRHQILHHRAARISFEAVPDAWKQAPIIHLGPIADEMDARLPAGFSPTLLGLTPQGWMRAWDGSGRVRARAWESAGQALRESGAVVLSVEDVSGDESVIEAMALEAQVLAVTEGPAGARLYWNGDLRRFRAPEVEEVDATGAGDIFAAGFFARLHATRDPWEAARFATKLAACSVGRRGLEGIPTRSEIQTCMVEVF